MIEGGAADALGLPSFAELHVAGMSSKVASSFRRASTLSLGPLTMTGPLMMQMAVGGLVTGAPGPVIGIIGCVDGGQDNLTEPSSMQRTTLIKPKWSLQQATSSKCPRILLLYHQNF